MVNTCLDLAAVESLLLSCKVEGKSVGSIECCSDKWWSRSFDDGVIA